MSCVLETELIRRFVPQLKFMISGSIVTGLRYIQVRSLDLERRKQLIGARNRSSDAPGLMVRWIL